MDGAFLHSIWTVLLLVIFVGIVVWVFFVKRSSDFDQAARMPLESDDDESGSTINKVDGNG